MLRIAERALKLGAAHAEGVRHVLEEYEAEDHVLVHRRVQHGEKLFGRCPKLFVQIVQVLLLG